MDEFCYFSSPIYRLEVPNWIQRISERCEALYEKQINFCKQNNIGTDLIQTSSIHQDPCIKPFSDFVLGQSVLVLEKQGYDTNRYNIYFDALWAQRLEVGASHNVHVHPQTILSGFYILDTQQNENSSYPIFADPRPGKLMCDLFFSRNGPELNTIAPYIHFNNLLNGTLMIFNSWVPHIITPNNSSKPFKFIHFCVSAKLL